MIASETQDSYTILGGRTDAGAVVLCDHASNRLPDGYGTLGLPDGQMERHIAYDIGAAAVSRQVAEALGAPLVQTHYSRLLIDPNRGEDDPTMIMRLSDGAVIPGNRYLDEAEREARVLNYYRPYHDAISRVIDKCLAAGQPPVLLSIHSFTESWKGAPRPWHVGILWDQDGRLAKPLLDAFFARHDLIVGDNEPYTGRLPGDTMWKHGTLRGLAHAIVEIRQDLIRNADGQAQWSSRISNVMRDIMADPANAADFRAIKARHSK
ncbi:MAG TPA: N-formylglutamate amidohydrolase [Hyphomicrobiaceae bacterium]|nr:N-formylglutamate amidohydrolase [Hyphomicrobiaceae bacterium]